MIVALCLFLIILDAWKFFISRKKSKKKPKTVKTISPKAFYKKRREGQNNIKNLIKQESLAIAEV
jgi:hypothetical protein